MAIFSDESWRLEPFWYMATKGTFLPNYTEISPVVSDEKIKKKISYKYICIRLNNPTSLAPLSHPLTAIFPDESWRLEQSWYRVIKGTFLSTEFSLVVSDKKNFKVFCADILENEPRPLEAWLFWLIILLNQPWYMITKGTFLPNYIETSLLVSDKKIIKIFFK